MSQLFMTLTELCLHLALRQHPALHKLSLTLLRYQDHHLHPCPHPLSVSLLNKMSAENVAPIHTPHLTRQVAPYDSCSYANICHGQQSSFGSSGMFGPSPLQPLSLSPQDGFPQLLDSSGAESDYPYGCSNQTNESAQTFTRAPVNTTFLPHSATTSAQFITNLANGFKLTPEHCEQAQEFNAVSEYFQLVLFLAHLKHSCSLCSMLAPKWLFFMPKASQWINRSSKWLMSLIKPWRNLGGLRKLVDRHGPCPWPSRHVFWLSLRKHENHPFPGCIQKSSLSLLDQTSYYIQDHRQEHRGKALMKHSRLFC